VMAVAVVLSLGYGRSMLWRRAPAAIRARAGALM
jgi:hypothetical protein